MITLTTSLSPSINRFNHQLKAIKSWRELGFEITSLNHVKDISELVNTDLASEYSKHGVKFIPTERGLIEENRRFVFIDELINLATKISRTAFIINSDIILKDKRKIEEIINKAQQSLVFVSRYNYDNKIEECSIEKFGLDIFVFNSDFRKLIPPSTFVIGKPLWDYWIPYHFALTQTPIFSIHDKVAFHKNHPKAWNIEDWKKMAPNFRQYEHLKNLGNKELSKTVRNTIISKIQIVSAL